MPTTPPPAPPPKQGSPSLWRLLLARFCLRIAGFELRRGRYGRIARFGTSAAVNLGRAASRTRREDKNESSNSAICCGAYVAYWHIASIRGSAALWSLSEPPAAGEGNHLVAIETCSS